MKFLMGYVHLPVALAVLGRFVKDLRTINKWGPHYHSEGFYTFSGNEYFYLKGYLQALVFLAFEPVSTTAGPFHSIISY